MPDVIETIVLDQSGEIVWRGPESNIAEVAELTRDTWPDNSALRMTLGDASVPRCHRGDVMHRAEQLSMVSRHGMPEGYLATLPAGTLFEASVNAFNQDHLAALSVNQVDFPLVFDVASEEMGELTKYFGAQNRMFKLADHADSMRLSYAADPNLFAWLARRVLDHKRLPYAVYSPQPVFRNFQSGEIDIEHRRQFTVPDIHIIAERDAAAESYLQALSLAGESTSFWFADDRIHQLDSVVGTEHDTDLFFRSAAAASRSVTIVRRLAKRTKYYAQKTGIMVFAGYGNLMLYNLQLDDVNGPRFGVCTDSGNSVTIIHATVAMAGSRLLPAIIGRGLSGVTPPVLPPELAPSHLVLVPITQDYARYAYSLAEPLIEQGFRVFVDQNSTRSIGARIAKIRRGWQPLYAVIGERDVNQSPTLFCAGKPVNAEYSDYLASVTPRWRRCLPAGHFGATPPPILGSAQGLPSSAIQTERT